MLVQFIYHYGNHYAGNRSIKNVVKILMTGVFKRCEKQLIEMQLVA